MLLPRAWPGGSAAGGKSELIRTPSFLFKCSFLSSSLLKGSKKESVKCDSALIIFSGAFRYFLHKVGGGRIGDRWGKKNEAKMCPWHRPVLPVFLQVTFISNFDGTGHALFIDNNCYRTSEGHVAKPETWRGLFEGLCSQLRNGKDGARQLLGSSSEPCQECPIVRSAGVGQGALCQSQKCGFQPT